MIIHKFGTLGLRSIGACTVSVENAGILQNQLNWSIRSQPISRMFCGPREAFRMTNDSMFHISRAVIRSLEEFDAYCSVPAGR